MRDGGDWVLWGGHCIEALSDFAEIEVIAACRDAARLPAGFRGRAVVGDLRDEAYLDRLLADCDVLIHAAAWTSLWGHRKESDELFLKPSLALIDAARRHGVKRFVFISTISAAAPREFIRPDEPGLPGGATGPTKPMWSASRSDSGRSRERASVPSTCGWAFSSAHATHSACCRYWFHA